MFIADFTGLLMTDSIRVHDILAQLNSSAPFDLAESWDNVGLLVGDPAQQVQTILVGLDPTCNLVEEAIARGANIIVTHHPVIFHPLKTINSGEPEGRLLAMALSHSIAIIGCHTNLDSACRGVSDILGERLGLTDLRPLIPSGAEESTGLGAIGRFEQPMVRKEFIQKVLETLELPSVQMVGTPPEFVENVALCGGSGSDFVSNAYQAGADVYLSAEIKHATAIWAKERDFCIIDGTHFATEYPAVSLLVNQLRQLFSNNDRINRVLQAKCEQHPFVIADKSCSM